MPGTDTPLKGTVHGRTIELDAEPGFADGQEVTVVLRPAPVPGDGIRQSAGGWADAGDAIDDWLDEMQRERKQDRPEVPFMAAPNPSGISADSGRSCAAF